MYNKCIIKIEEAYLNLGFILTITKFKILSKPIDSVVRAEGIDNITLLNQDHYREIIKEKGLWKNGAYNESHEEYYTSPNPWQSSRVSRETVQPNGHQCKECGKCYKQQKGLITHMIKLHPLID